MRLFIALLFDNNTKQAIGEVQNNLKALSRAGNFTRDENLHLTLLFLGETERHKIKDIEAIFETLKTEAFTLTLSGFGNFGSVYWLGVQKVPALTSLYKQLYDGLTVRGFTLENRAFRPHITLARELVPLAGFDKASFGKNVPLIQQDVRRVSLMKSERIGGALVYTEILSREL